MRTVVSLVVMVAVIGGTALACQLLVNAGQDNDGIDSSTSADSRNPEMGRTVPGNWTGLLAVTWAARDEKARGRGGDDVSSDSSSSDSASGDGAAATAGGLLPSVEVAFCPKDINRNGYVDVFDLIEVLLCYGQPAAPGCQDEDLVHDGIVDVTDLLDLLSSMGQPCGAGS